VGLAYPHDEAALAAAIESVVALSADDRERMGREASQSARRRYDWEAITDQYEELFASLARR
jgi:glycosyltransferase involved in cell wall biosynthesis